MNIILVFIYMILTILGLILIKKGANPGKVEVSRKNINVSISPVSALGFVCYLCSFLIFIKIVIMFDLSYIMPVVTGIGQVCTLIVARLIFKEKIDKKSIIGVSLVIIGIIVMNIKM